MYYGGLLSPVSSVVKIFFNHGGHTGTQGKRKGTFYE
jgi:hypothetical protein